MNRAARQKLHEALIGIALLLLPISMAMIGYSAVQDQYKTATGYNETRLEEQRENLNKIQNQTQQTTEELRDLRQNPSVADLLGAALLSAYGAFTQLGAVIDFIFQLVVSLVEFLPFGPIGDTIVSVIIFAVNAWFFVGFIGNVITKSDRT